MGKNEFVMENLITFRAQRLKHPEDIAAILGSGFILAGGALSSDDPPKDFDIYCREGINISQIRDWLQISPKWNILSKTKNAITADHYGQIIQFCAYHKDTVKELIESFDFSNCQAAAVFDINGAISRTVYTDRFIAFVYDGFIQYTGSEYPLASLMRCAKLISRGVIKKPQRWKPIILDIVTDIVRRGFVDEDDFSDQCDSISESFRSMNSDARDLFELLQHKTEGGQNWIRHIVVPISRTGALETSELALDESS